MPKTLAATTAAAVTVPHFATDAFPSAAALGRIADPGAFVLAGLERQAAFRGMLELVMSSK